VGGYLAAPNDNFYQAEQTDAGEEADHSTLGHKGQLKYHGVIYFCTITPIYFSNYFYSKTNEP